MGQRIRRRAVWRLEDEIDRLLKNRRQLEQIAVSDLYTPELQDAARRGIERTDTALTHYRQQLRTYTADPRPTN